MDRLTLPAPYYSRAGHAIYLGDSRDVLPRMTKESVGVIVTDPPYGVNWQSNFRRVRFEPIAGDDGSLDVLAILSGAGLCLRRSRHAYIFGQFQDLQFPLTAKANLIWDKGRLGSGDVQCAWGPSHEFITFAYRTADRAAKNLAGGGVPARLRSGSVLRYAKPYALRHPTEKPVALLRRLIESSSFPGEVVLDPFMGVGSTAVAAVAEGRASIGIEVDEKYAEIAAQRLDRALDYASGAVLAYG